MTDNPTLDEGMPYPILPKTSPSDHIHAKFEETYASTGYVPWIKSTDYPHEPEPPRSTAVTLAEVYQPNPDVNPCTRERWINYITTMGEVDVMCLKISEATDPPKLERVHTDYFLPEEKALPEYNFTCETKEIKGEFTLVEEPSEVVDDKNEEQYDSGWFDEAHETFMEKPKMGGEIYNIIKKYAIKSQEAAAVECVVEKELSLMCEDYNDDDTVTQKK